MLLDRIKVLAHQQDIPYQSLIKMWLFRDVEKAYRASKNR
jgi:predicted DNA binding CopG/RHH family protein